MRIHAFRLSPGDDLKLALEKFVAEHQIVAGAILTCVGSLQEINLRMAGASSGTIIKEKFEIVSLVGTLSTNGSHLHIGLSDKNGKMTGGHLLAGCLIYTTAEMVIAEFTDLTFTRVTDAGTGYKELVVNMKQK